MADKELNKELDSAAAEVEEKVSAVKEKDDDSKKPEKKKGTGEIKKITWPTPKQTLHNTLVVIGAMILVGIFVFLLDTAFSKVVELLADIGK